VVDWKKCFGADRDGWIECFSVAEEVEGDDDGAVGGVFKWDDAESCARRLNGVKNVVNIDAWLMCVLVWWEGV